jgi:hypothetical protein
MTKDDIQQIELNGTRHYRAAKISGEPNDPPAEACAKLNLIFAPEEKLLRSSANDDNLFVDLR